MPTTHFTALRDLGPEGLESVISRAIAWKKQPPIDGLKGRILGMVFFNPSLRTRASFEAAMIRSGGHAIVLEVGSGVWSLEHRDGVVMDENRTEHIREAVPVLSRYVDALAIRTFSDGTGDDADEADVVLNGFRKYSTTPVVSMESAREHPCQGLADVLTMREKFGATKGLDVTLSWAPHVKPLPKAVPNSFLLSAAAAGCNVRVAHPKGFELTASVLNEGVKLADQAGGSIIVTNDQSEALRGSHVVYAKAWGPSSHSSAREEAAKPELRQQAWMTTTRHMDLLAKDGVFMHCLPTRRGLEVADEILDSKRSLVVDEAENRFHVQRVILHDLLKR
ncbi:MAG: N-acetylornithine carbamoyltransferase [Clostridia bacterium]|nr:N-acetylornithine carbamoyltransferase [Deltaproteobacteria bacterium]